MKFKRMFLIFFLFFLSNASFADDNSCKDYKDESECQDKDDLCVWDKKASCLEKNDNSCSLATAQESCSKLNCFWASKSGVCKSQADADPCLKPTDSKSCKNMNCVWSQDENSCHSKSGYGLGSLSCSKNTSEVACNSRYWGCIWESKNKSCLNNTYWNASNPSLFLQEDTCKSVTGYFWDAETKTCFSAGGIRDNRSSCNLAKSTTACSKLKSCGWDSVTGCLEPKQCISAKSEDGCKSMPECLWQSEKKLCLLKSDSSQCPLFDKANCLASNKTCTFDTGLCISNSSHTPSLDSFKGKKDLIKWSEQYDVHLNHHFKYDDKKCRFFRVKENCEKFKYDSDPGIILSGPLKNVCTWDDDKGLCFETHTEFCEYASQSVCNKLLHCKWDDTSKTCLQEKADCEYVKSEDLCLKMSSCQWDSRKFCSNRKSN